LRGSGDGEEDEESTAGTAVSRRRREDPLTPALSPEGRGRK